jgi:hypothetical protein
MRVYGFVLFRLRRRSSVQIKLIILMDGVADRMAVDRRPEQKGPKRQSAQPPKPSRLLITVGIALITAGGSAWLILRSSAIRCDSLAPLTVLATLAAFLISICFRQMGRFPDRRSRLFLLACLLVAAATLFADFRFVRQYRDFCDQLQQEIRQAPPQR